jgi:hypothetical protein
VTDFRRRLSAYLALVVALLLAGCGGGGGSSENVESAGDWSIVDPGEVGVNASKLATAARRIGEEYPNIRSVLVARDGRLALERYYGWPVATSRVLTSGSRTSSLSGSGRNQTPASAGSRFVTC